MTVSRISTHVVIRRTDPVETRVRLGQLRDLASLLDSEATWPVRSLQVLESVDGDSRGTGGELQQAGLRR